MGEFEITAPIEVEPFPVTLTVLHNPCALIVAPLGNDDVTLMEIVAPTASVQTAKTEVEVLAFLYFATQTPSALRDAVTAAYVARRLLT